MSEISPEYRCPECPAIYSTRKALFSHMRAHERTQVPLPDNYPCRAENCTKVFESAGNRNQHERRYHKKRGEHVSQEREVPRYFCREKNCEKTFGQRGYRITHELEEHGLKYDLESSVAPDGRYICRVRPCSMSFPNERNRAYHEKKRHGTMNVPPNIINEEQHIVEKSDYSLQHQGHSIGSRCHKNTSVTADTPQDEQAHKRNLETTSKPSIQERKYLDITKSASINDLSTIQKNEKPTSVQELDSWIEKRLNNLSDEDLPTEEASELNAATSSIPLNFPSDKTPHQPSAVSREIDVMVQACLEKLLFDDPPTEEAPQRIEATPSISLTFPSTIPENASSLADTIDAIIENRYVPTQNEKPPPRETFDSLGRIRSSIENHPLHTCSQQYATCEDVIGAMNENPPLGPLEYPLSGKNVSEPVDITPNITYNALSQGCSSTKPISERGVHEDFEVSSLQHNFSKEENETDTNKPTANLPNENISLYNIADLENCGTDSAENFSSNVFSTQNIENQQTSSPEPPMRLTPPLPNRNQAFEFNDASPPRRRTLPPQSLKPSPTGHKLHSNKALNISTRITFQNNDTNPQKVSKAKNSKMSRISTHNAGCSLRGIRKGIEKGASRIRETSKKLKDILRGGPSKHHISTPIQGQQKEKEYETQLPTCGQKQGQSYFQEDQAVGQMAQSESIVHRDEIQDNVHRKRGAGDKNWIAVREDGYEEENEKKRRRTK